MVLDAIHIGLKSKVNDVAHFRINCLYLNHNTTYYLSRFHLVEQHSLAILATFGIAVYSVYSTTSGAHRMRLSCAMTLVDRSHFAHWRCY